MHTMPRPYFPIALAAAAIAIGTPAHRTVAQDDDAAPPDASDPAITTEFDGQVRTEDWFRIEARPVAWYPALSGDVTFGPGNNNPVTADDGLGLEDNELTFSGDVTLHFDRFSLWLNAFDFGTDASGPAAVGFTVGGAPVAAGTPIDAQFDLTNLSAHVGFDLFENLLSAEDEDVNMRGPEEAEILGMPADFRLHLLGGVRALNFDQSLAAAGGGPSFDYDEWTGAVEVGGRLALGLGPSFGRKGRWDVSTAVLAGFGGTGDADLSTIDVWFGLHYTVLDHLGIAFGYRQLDFDLDASDDSDNPFEFDGRLAGLFLGASIKF